MTPRKAKRSILPPGTVSIRARDPKTGRYTTGATDLRRKVTREIYRVGKAGKEKRVYAQTEPAPMKRAEYISKIESRERSGTRPDFTPPDFEVSFRRPGDKFVQETIQASGLLDQIISDMIRLKAPLAHFRIALENIELLSGKKRPDISGTRTHNFSFDFYLSPKNIEQLLAGTVKGDLFDELNNRIVGTIISGLQSIGMQFSAKSKRRGKNKKHDTIKSMDLKFSRDLWKL